MNMEEKLNALADKLDRLRCDLSATNSALAAVMTALPAEAREQALKSLAELSVMKSETVDQLPTPAAQAAARQLLAAENRVYQLLQGTHRMRQAKEQSH